MAKRNTKQDRIENPKDYMLHPTKGYRRIRWYLRDYIAHGEALFVKFKAGEKLHG